MAISSTMLALGTKAPDFNLPDVVSGENISLSKFVDKPLLVMFICRHCPYVQHVKKELAKIGKDYKDNGLGIVAISSNDTSVYPEDAPESLAEMAREEDFNFPYLYDESQEVAKNYTAACTPDLFLFDKDRGLVYKRSLKTRYSSEAFKLVYRGQLDDSRPGSEVPVTGKDMRTAIDAVLSGSQIDPNQKPSTGCGIKWKEGNEPEYFK